MTLALAPAGVEQVVVVEPAEARKQKAAGAGAATVLDPRAVDVVEAVEELTKGRGADVTFECAGVDQVLATAIRSTHAGGTGVDVAIWGHEARVAMNDLVLREVGVLGSLDTTTRRRSRWWPPAGSTRSRSSPGGSASTTSSSRGSAS